MATSTESARDGVPADIDIEDLTQRIVGGPQVEIVATGTWGEVRFTRTDDAVVSHIAPTRVIGSAASMTMLAERLNDSTAWDVAGVETPFAWRADLRGFSITASACIHLDGDRFACCRTFIRAARNAIERAIECHRRRRGPEEVAPWDRRRTTALEWVRTKLRHISNCRVPELPKNGARDYRLLVVCLAPSLEPLEKTLLLRAIAGNVLTTEDEERLLAALEIDRECAGMILQHGSPLDIQQSWRRLPIAVDALMSAATSTGETSRPADADKTGWGGESAMAEHTQSEDAPDGIMEGGAEGIRAALSARVRGQDDAIDGLSVALYRHQQQCHRGAVLVRGPTGVGKSLMIGHGAALLGVPVVHVSAASLVPEGIYGPTLTSTFLDLFERSGRNIQSAQRGIVLLDEIDKISRDSSSKYGDAVLSQLLRVLDGCVYQLVADKRDFQLHTIDTSRMLFVLAGAWMDLEREAADRVGFDVGQSSVLKCLDGPQNMDDLGLSPELQGRIATSIRLRPLSADTMRDIIIQRSTTPLAQLLDHLDQRASTLEVDDLVIDRWVERAIDDGLGARGLHQQIDAAVRSIWRRCGSEREMTYRVKIDGVCVAPLSLTAERDG